MFFLVLLYSSTDVSHFSMNLFICVWLLYISSPCWLCFCQCRLWGTWVNRWGISFRRSPRLTKISTQSTWERCLLSMLQLLSRQCGLLSDHGSIRGLKRKLKFMALTSLQSYLSWLIARTSLCSSEAHAVAQEDVRMQMLALGMKVPTRRNRFLMNLWRHWISCVLTLQALVKHLLTPSFRVVAMKWAEFAYSDYSIRNLQNLYIAISAILVKKHWSACTVLSCIMQGGMQASGLEVALWSRDSSTPCALILLIGW